jgi:hypothetical protein
MRALRLLPALLLAACTTCPPRWVAYVPEDAGWLHATGTAGKVYVEADARNLALTRAARCLADALDLDVEQRLSVVLSDGRLFVEAFGPEGQVHGLDALELVGQAECDGVLWVLVRIPRD